MGRLIDACKVIEKINGAIELLGIASKTAAGNEGFQTTIKAYRDVRDAIMQEPTAEPQTAEWVMVRYSIHPSLARVTCNRCGGQTLEQRTFKFCPECGSKMVNAADNVARLRIITREQLMEEMENG